MSILEFKPYKFPIPAMAGWNDRFNVDQARAYIAPRGNVYAFLIPQKSKRFIIANFQTGYKIFDRDGRRLLTFPKKVREVANRMPPRTVADFFISGENVTLIDILIYHAIDVRSETLENRLGHWWYLPEDYRNRRFYNETNSDKLDGKIFQHPFFKVIFKPDFVSYPINSSRRKVYNWLEMKKPPASELEENAAIGQSGNLSNLRLRHTSPRGFARDQSITP